MRNQFLIFGIGWIILALLLSAALVCGQENHKENLTAKRLAVLSLLINNACEGAEQWNNWVHDDSKWDWYNKKTEHAFYFTKRGAQVVSVLAAANWHPRQKLLSWRTANQFVYITALQSWTLNRTMRKVQTGNWLPDEREHSWYLDFGWLRLEIRGRNEQQWALLGLGLAGLAIDMLWNKL